MLRMIPVLLIIFVSLAFASGRAFAEDIPLENAALHKQGEAAHGDGASQEEELIPSHPDGIVSGCFSGDTIKLMDRRVVRLSGIDAPNMPIKDKKRQFYARQSKKILEELIKGKNVHLELPGEKIKDSYGRLLADVKLDDGQSINEALVERGAAYFFPFPDLPPSFQERLSNMQADAIKEKRGFWEYILSLPLARENYVGNKENLRFYPVNCPQIQLIRPRNRVDFGNLMDAFLAGYAPSRICPIWPDDKD